MHERIAGRLGTSFSFEALEDRRLLSSAPPYAHATDNDIAIGSDGSIHVAWYDSEVGSLNYASRTAGGTWSNSVTIDSIPGLPPGGYGVGQYVTLALDSQNRPAVSYTDAPNGDLKFASRATGSWVVNTANIENTVALYPSLAFNASNTPVVSYYIQNTRDLKLARWTGSAWTKETVDATDDVGRWTSLHLIPGSTDRFAIAYEKTTGGDFKYAEFTTSNTWASVFVDTVPVAGGGFTSLDFDTAGNPAFAYYDADSSTLKYKSRSGTTWAASPIVVSDRISHWSKLHFDSGNLAHIVYYDVQGNYAAHVTKTSAATFFSSSNVILRAGGGNYVSTAFKSDGTIAYTYGSPYPDAVPQLGVGVLAGNIVQQPTWPPPPPVPPPNPTTVISNSRIDLAWIYSGSANTGFKVSISTDGGKTYPDERTIASAGARSAQITGLSGATAYTFSVRAYNANGDSTFSGAQSATTLVNPPAAPSALSATSISNEQINLSWQDVQGETAYKVERSANGTTGWTEIAQPAANVTTHNDSFQLTSGTQYHYRVRAINAGGNSTYSAAVSAFTRPGVPGVLQAAAVSAYQVDLSWSDVSGETGYTLERSLTGTGEWTAIHFGANVTSYADTAVSADTTYYYRIRATNAGGDSAHATFAPATTLQDPSLSFTLVGTTLSVQAATGTPFYLRHSTVGFEVFKDTSATGTPLYFIDDPFTSLSVTSHPDDTGKLEWVSGAAPLSELIVDGGTLDLIGTGSATIGTLAGSGSVTTFVGMLVEGDVDLAGQLSANEDITVDGNLTAGSFTGAGTSNVGGTFGGGNSLFNDGVMTIGGISNPSFDIWNRHPMAVLTIIGDVTCYDLVNDGTMNITGNAIPFGHFLNRVGTATIGGDLSPYGGLANSGGIVVVAGNASPGGVLDNRDGSLTVYGDVTPAGDLYNDEGALLYAGGAVVAGGLLSNLGTITTFPFLSIDSDNSGAIDAADNAIEDDATKPGKIIAVNDDDTDGDGIPDFADGYDFDDIIVNDGQTAGEQFVPMTITLPAGIDAATAKLRFAYSGSNPRLVQLGVEGPMYTAAPGHLRLWKKPGDAERNPDPANQHVDDVELGGDYIVPDAADAHVEYQAAALGFTATERTKTIWVEAVRESEAIGDQRVEVTIDLDGAGPQGFVAADAVRTTLYVVQLDAVSVGASGDPSNTVSASDRSVQRLFVQPASDGTVALTLNASGETVGSISRSLLLWKLSGNEANPAHGTFESPDVAASLNRLNPAENVFVLQAGVDANADGTLSTTEVLRTIKIVVGYKAADLWEALEADAGYGPKLTFLRQRMSEIGHPLVVETLILRDFDGTADAAYVDRRAENLAEAKEWAIDALREWAGHGVDLGGDPDGKIYFAKIAREWARSYATDAAVTMGQTLDFLYLFSKHASGSQNDQMYYANSSARSTYSNLPTIYMWIFAGRAGDNGSIDHPGQVKSDAAASLHVDYWDFNDPEGVHGDQNHHFAGFFFHAGYAPDYDIWLQQFLDGSGDYPRSVNPGDYQLGVMAADFARWWQDNLGYHGAFLTSLLKQPWSSANAFFQRTTFP